MPLDSFEQLYRDADASGAAVPVAVAGGAERTVLEALRTACDRGWVAPRVAGCESDIRRVAIACGVGLHGFTILDAD